MVFMRENVFPLFLFSDAESEKARIRNLKNYLKKRKEKLKGVKSFWLIKWPLARGGLS